MVVFLLNFSFEIFIVVAVNFGIKPLALKTFNNLDFWVDIIDVDYVSRSLLKILVALLF